MDVSHSSKPAQGVPSRPGTETVILIDEMMGAYLFGEGTGMRLHVEGRQFAADDALPDEAFQGLNRTGNARAFVIGHMVRRFGGDSSRWPLAVRFFIHG
jgi:hypothetical protein